MSTNLIKALTPRRTIYQLGKENFPLKNEQVVSIVREIVALTPSSFNNQTTRAIVLFGAAHDKLWDEIAVPALKAVTPEEQWPTSEGKLKSFAAGYGTVLFFEDENSVRATQEKYALYASNFPIWASESAGAAQINTWSALADEGVGASLQHYSPLIAKQVAEAFKVPDNWRLISQLVFGTKLGSPYEKETLDTTETVKVVE